MGLSRDFESTVSAIAYSILRENFPGREPCGDASFNRAVRFVLGQHGRMPDYLRLPLAAVTLAFDWSSLLRHGRRFHRLPHAARWRKLEAWKGSRISVCRDFVRFFDALVVFYWYSKAEIPAPEERSAPAPRPARTAA